MPYKNKKRKSERDKEYYLENKDNILAHNKDYGEKWREENKAKIKEHRLRNRDKRILYENEYNNTPRGRNFKKVRDARRNAKKRLLKHSFTVEEWQQKLKATFGICSGYHKEPHYVGVEKLTLDHKIPISKAPVNFEYTINDIQALCLGCNQSKGTSIT